MPILTTTGVRARNPYHLKELDWNVYSLEELCYAVYKSAQFLSEDLVDPALVKWLSEECGLNELSRSLSALLGVKGVLPEFVQTLLRASDYLSEELKKQTVAILRAGEGLELFEQREAKADYLMDSGHFYQALSEYDAILESLPAEERNMRARVEHSRGVIYTELFRFAYAADCFDRAYRLTGSRKFYRDYLAAIRLYLPDADYVSFIARHPEAYDASLALEKRMEEVRDYAESTIGSRQIARLKNLNKDGDSQEFAEELAATLKELRSNYRANMTVG